MGLLLIKLPEDVCLPRLELLLHQKEFELILSFRH